MKFTYLIVVGLFFLSCKKKEITPDPIDPMSEPCPVFSFADNEGSYWIYEWFEIDDLGNETSLDIRDSVFAIGDTLIDGNTFSHFSGTYMGIETERIVRDSSGFIINTLGDIRYSRNNTSDTISYYENTMANYKIYGLSQHLINPLVTPAGSYSVDDAQSHYYTLDETPFTACDSVWISHRYYDDANGVEIKSQTAFFTQIQNLCIYRERRLVTEFLAP